MHFGCRVVFFGQQPGGAHEINKLVEQYFGVLSAAYCAVGLDQSGRADVEATFQPGQSVVVAVPKDGGSYPQHTFHGINCVQEPFIGYL